MRAIVTAVTTLVVLIAIIVLLHDVVMSASSRIRDEPKKPRVSEVSPAQPQGETN